MKSIKIVTLKELEAYIEWRTTNVLHSKKIATLNDMGVRSIYQVSISRGKTEFSAKVSDRIINYAKGDGYEFN